MWNLLENSNYITMLPRALQIRMCVKYLHSGEKDDLTYKNVEETEIIICTDAEIIFQITKNPRIYYLTTTSCLIS